MSIEHVKQNAGSWTKIIKKIGMALYKTNTQTPIVLC